MTLNGIARGYAADRVARAIAPLGALRALLDTDAFAIEGAGESYHFAIVHPRQPGRAMGTLRASTGFIATCGDYNTPFTADFSCNHIFDPRTGRSPAGLASVTVVATNGAAADGLATAFMVMGAEKTRSFIATHPEFGALLIGKNLSVENCLGPHAHYEAA